jgi:hypothetical protein
MELILFLAVLGMAGVAGLFILRLSWSRRKSSAHYTFFPILFSVWIVSVVVWNTYFASYKIFGLFDLSVERFLFLLLGVSAAYQLVTKRVRLSGDHALELVMLIFLVICVISMSLNGFAAMYAYAPKPWYVFFSGYFVPFMAFFFAKYFFEDIRSLKMLLAVLFALGVYLCLISILERYDLNSLVHPAYITDERFPLHLDRSRGPLLNAAFNGLAMTICFTAGMMLLPLVGPGGRFLILGLVPLFFPGVFSRPPARPISSSCWRLGRCSFFCAPDGPSGSWPPWSWRCACSASRPTPSGCSPPAGSPAASPRWRRWRSVFSLSPSRCA